MEERPVIEDQRTANLLGALALAVSDMVLEAARQEAGGTSEAAAIVRIGMHAGKSIDFLSRALQLSHSATVRLVDRLQTDGLVRRLRNFPGSDGDRRSVALHLTVQGEQRLRSILARRYQRLKPLLGMISDSERTQLAAIAMNLLAGISCQRHLPHICRLCDYEACKSAGCPVHYYLPEVIRNETITKGHRQHLRRDPKRIGRP